MKNRYDILVGSFTVLNREDGSTLDFQRPALDVLFRRKISLMQEGIVARVTDRGFGFIKRANEEKDLFFHSNELKNVKFEEIREGDKVTFEVAQGPKGPNAVNVNRAKITQTPPREGARGFVLGVRPKF